MSYDYKGDDLFASLRGRTIRAFEKLEQGSDDVLIHFDDGPSIRMIYHPDCCASAWLEEIIGDPADLIGEPLLEAEVVAYENEKPAGVDKPEPLDSFTWVFYKLGTRKGAVTLRFLGESNGYYSERVTVEEAR